jgi:RNA polymerase sigma-70 factor (ECF subfamily)
MASRLPVVPPVQSTDELVELRRGGSDIVATIYEKHSTDLCRVIGRILLEREATYDCLHDIFVDLPRRLASFDGRASLGTWLHRIAVRAAIDELRRRQRRRRLMKLLRPFAQQAEAPMPELAAIRDETAVSVEEALRREAPLDRAVLVLTSLEGYGYAEAAETLGITIEALRGRHKRVRARLSRQLAHLRETD